MTRARHSAAPLINGIRRAMLVPRVAVLAARAPRNPVVAWERYWKSVHATGTSGDVLWDLETDDEFAQYRTLLEAHFDRSLPVVDIGCGNGRFTRWLASMFPLAIGIDVADAAIDRARIESEDRPNVEFLTADAAAASTGPRLRSRFGEANIFVRGVFHVLDERSQVAAAASARCITGSFGRLLLAETDFRGSGLEYLQSLGATARSIPRPLERAIGGLPRPGHFGRVERSRSFPAAEWEVIVDGPTQIRTVPMRTQTLPETIPGYLAVLAPAVG